MIKECARVVNSKVSSGTVVRVKGMQSKLSSQPRMVTARDYAESAMLGGKRDGYEISTGLREKRVTSILQLRVLPSDNPMRVRAPLPKSKPRNVTRLLDSLSFSDNSRGESSDVSVRVWQHNIHLRRLFCLCLTCASAAVITCPISQDMRHIAGHVDSEDILLCTTCRMCVNNISGVMFPGLAKKEAEDKTRTLLENMPHPTSLLRGSVTHLSMESMSESTMELCVSNSCLRYVSTPTLHEFAQSGHTMSSVVDNADGTSSVAPYLKAGFF